MRPGPASALLLALLALAVPATAQAASGDLDAGFGTKGVAQARTASPPITSLLRKAPGDKLVQVAWVRSGTGDKASNDIVVVRYSPGGRLDTAFGGGDGTVIIPGRGFLGIDARVLPDGGIIVLGADSGASGHALVRLRADGSLDPAFGNAGVAAGQPGAFSGMPGAVERGADGSFTVGGGYDGGFALERFTPSGQLDRGFLAIGSAVLDLPLSGASAATPGRINDLIALPDGSLVAGGAVGARAALARVTTEGTLDRGFGTDGEVLVGDADPTGCRSSTVSRLALDSQNRLLAAGSFAQGAASIGFLARLSSSSGATDPSFGGGARFVSYAGTSSARKLSPRDVCAGGSTDPSFSSVLDLGVETEDRPVVSGTYGTTDRSGFGIARFKADGTPDTAFSGDGVDRVDFGARCFAQAGGLALFGDRAVLGGGVGSGLELVGLRAAATGASAGAPTGLACGPGAPPATTYRPALTRPGVSARQPASSARITVRLTGRLTKGPKACTGNVRVEVRRSGGARILGRRTVKLASSCRYSTSVVFGLGGLPRGLRAHSSRLRLVIASRYLGVRNVRADSAPRASVVVRRR